MARSRARRLAALLAVALVALTLAAPASAGASAGAPSQDTRPFSADDGRTTPTTILRAVTGVRSGADTVLGGAILNDTDHEAQVPLRIEGLPAGVSITSVRPDRSHPEDGRWWECEATTCRLVGGEGQTAPLSSGADIGLVLALGSSSLPERGGEVTVAVGDMEPAKVALDLPDDAPALAADAIGVDVVGPTTVAPGATLESAVTVSNLGTVTTVPGSVNVTQVAPVVAGMAVSAEGDGWTCTPAGSCTWNGVLEPLAVTPVLRVTSTAPASVPDPPAGTLSIVATARLGATDVRAEDTLPIAVRTPESHGVSAEVHLADHSVSPPTSSEMVLRITPTGMGDLSERVRLSVDEPDDVTIDWSAVRTDGPWTCGATPAGCESTGPLPGGTASEVHVPLTVEKGATPGLRELELVADVGGHGSGERGSEHSGSEDRGRDSLVVDPPPVAEVRAELFAADTPTDDQGARITRLPLGAPIDFVTGAPRDLVVAVTNHGSRAAFAGSEIAVELAPDVTQHVDRVGDGRWTCAARATVDRDRPVSCRLRLDRDLDPGASLELPLVLAASEPGSSTWTVRSGLGRALPRAGARTYRVEVGERGPELVPTVDVRRELVRGGTGTVDLAVTNRGATDAAGAVLVVDLDAGLEPEELSGDGWTCAEVTVRFARGSVTCTTGQRIEPGRTSTTLSAVLRTDTHDRTTSLRLWSTSPGQRHPSGARAATTVALDVHHAGELHAGNDLTVVSPVRAADGSEHPAIVLLRSDVDPGRRTGLRWSQLCTTSGEHGCDTVDPAVTWLGVAPGEVPTTPDARFVAPADLSGETVLRFRVTSGHGRDERSDDLTVRLVPAALPHLDTASSGTPASGDRGATTSSAAANGRSSGSSGGGAGSGPTPTTSAPSPAGDDVAVQIGDGSTVQVATRRNVVLQATATGTGPFRYSWTQTGGPTADVIGSANGASFAVTAPDLDPDQSSEDLAFQVQVTDAAGNQATATAQVEVVWGDDGLQVTLAGGAPNVVATVDSPVAIASVVTSAGAPYDYDWSLDGGDVTLPRGTATDAATLAFTAPGAAGSTTAQLTVTDSFGRVTTEQVELSVTQLPAGQVPAALCTAVQALVDGTPATLGGAGGSVNIVLPHGTVSGNSAPTTTTTAAPGTTTTAPTTTAPSTTTSSTPGTSTTWPTTTALTPSSTTVTPTTTTTTTPPGPACAATSLATFTDASATLPGGVQLTGASGQLSIAGVTFTGGTVTLPQNWALTGATITDAGLLAPFVSTSQLGVPAGSIQADGVPFVAIDGWSGSSTMTFPDEGAPRASVDGALQPSSGTGVLTVSGDATGAGATAVTVRGHGVVGIGAVDVPISGSLVTTGPTDAVESTVTGMVSTPTPLASDVSVQAATLQWTPTSAAGTVQLALGSTSPLLLSATATVVGDRATLGFDPAANTWSPGGSGGPQLSFGGIGSVDAQLQLELRAAAVPSWSPARSVLVTDLAATVTSSCTLAPGSACDPTVALTAAATVAPTGSVTPSPVTGAFGLETGVTTLSSTVGTLTVAPLVVDDGTLAITLSPSGGTSVTATGTSAPVLGTPRPTTVSFLPAAVVAAARLGVYPLVQGWELDGAVALATDVDTSYDGVAGASLPVPLVAGSLTGAAAATLPPSLSQGVLPAEVTSGVVTFTITDVAPTQFVLDVAPPTDWYLAGSAEAGASVQLTDISYTIDVRDGVATVGVNGTGEVALGALANASTSPTYPLPFTGSLSTGTTGAALSLVLAAPDAPAWQAPGGVSGLTFDDVAVQVTLSGQTAATATFSASANLPAALASPLGIAPGSTPTVTADLTAPSACMVVDLDTGGALGIDVGGSGLVATAAASLVLAPDDCSVGGVDVPAGFTLVTDGALLGEQQLSIDPVTLAAASTWSLGQAQVGGLALGGTELDVAISDGLATVTVSGTATIEDETIALSGPASASVEPGSLGTVTLSGQVDTLTVDTLALTAVDATVAAQALLGPGAPEITLAATTALLGSDVAVQLSGSTSGTSIDQLTGSVESQTYALADGDTATTPLQITYDPSAPQALTVTSGADAALVSAAGWGFGRGILEVTPAGFALQAGIAIPGSLDLGVQVTGDYVLDPSGTDGTAGDFTFATASTVDTSFAGFDAGAMASFARAAGTVSADLLASISLGLFDEDAPVVVSTPLTPTTGDPALRGTLQGVSMRGLSGDAIITLIPASAPLGPLGWYDANVLFRTDPGTCDLWQGAPVLEGQIYRLAPTTYYTLSGTVTMDLPDGLSLAEIGQNGPQPLVLSNESSTAPVGAAPGPSLSIGMQSEAFTAIGTVSFAVSTCAYTVSGFLQLSWGASDLGSSLGNSFSPASGLGDQLGTGNIFGPGNSVPANIASFRAATQAKALLAARTALTASLQQAAQEANWNSEVIQGELGELVSKANTAEQELDAANAKFAAAQQAADAASTSADERATLAVLSADAGQADERLAAANQQLAKAQVDQATAEQKSETANTTLEAATDAREDSMQIAEAAEQAANESEQQEQQDEQNTTTLQVTLSWTHCTTCETVDTFSIGGEFYFELIYVVGLDLSLGWGADGFQSIDGTVSFGVEKQFMAGGSHLNVYANAEGEVEVTLGYDVGQGWVEAEAEVEMTAQLDVYLNVYIATYSAELADISLEATLEFIPSPVNISGSASIDVLGWSGTVHFGPDDF